MGLSTSNHQAKDGVRFRIAEVAKILEVSTAMLRKWERLGLVHPLRAKNGYRFFSQAEVRRLQEVQKLRTDKNLSSAAIVHILRKNEEATAVPNESPKVGLRLKRLREQQGLTLTEAAERGGISASYLSVLEHGHSHASVAVLQRLATLYGTTVLSFFGESLPSQKLVRPSGRRLLKTSAGVTMELLASAQCSMEPHLFRVPPGASSGGTYSHAGEEFIFMLRGTFDIWLDESEHYRITAGDSLYFSSRQAHRWANEGQEEVELIWCGSVPF